LIQTCDEDNPLTPNVGIATAGFVFGTNPLPLDHLMQDVIN
jgi:hypothetical protein